MIISDKFVNGVLYNDKDIDNILKIVRKTPKLFLKYVKVNRDTYIIKKFVNNHDYFAEDFDRYDSDVAEQFITYFIRFCKNEDFKKYCKDVDEYFVDHLKEFYQ